MLSLLTLHYNSFLFFLSHAFTLNASWLVLIHTTTHPVSSFRHRGGGGNKIAPPSMLRERCLGWTLIETSKEAKLHEGSASSVRLSVMKFPRLSHDASQTRRWLLFLHHQPTREICMSRPLEGRTKSLYRTTAADARRKWGIIKRRRGFPVFLGIAQQSEYDYPFNSAISSSDNGASRGIAS